MTEGLARHPVRVRFAPSPTGWLHIGGVRTALFNFLFARKMGGKFLLRIEDTDASRSEKKYTDDILSSLEWLGLTHDESIVYQSDREAVYTRIANELIEKGLAYRCYCTEAEVEATRDAMMKAGKKPMYARTCRDRTSPLEGRTSFAIRAKFPLEGETDFHDLIRGTIQFPNTDLDDFVMIRSSGVPTYNFVVVVDDIEMKITHVIRGDDHINNTPKQIYLYQALNAEKPVFAHLPMILGEDKKKLSKRNGETSANAYRAAGYLPEALLNFLVRLGWSHGDQELFSVQEMIDCFGFESVQVSGAVFNPEKLLWISGEHIKTTEPERLLQIIEADFLERFGQDARAQLQSAFALRLVPHLKPKVKLLTELADQLVPLLDPTVRVVDGTKLKWNKDEAQKQKIKEAIQALLSGLQEAAQASGAAISSGQGFDQLGLDQVGFDHARVDQLLRLTSEHFGLKLSDLTQPLRLYVTGSETAHIGLFDLIPIMPKSVLFARIEACIRS